MRPIILKGSLITLLGVGTIFFGIFIFSSQTLALFGLVVIVTSSFVFYAASPSKNQDFKIAVVQTLLKSLIVVCIFLLILSIILLSQLDQLSQKAWLAAHQSGHSLSYPEIKSLLQNLSLWICSFSLILVVLYYDIYQSFSIYLEKKLAHNVGLKKTKKYPKSL